MSALAICLCNSEVYALLSAWIGPYTSSLVVDTDKLCDLLDEKTDILDAPDAVELSDCKGAIEFSDGKR